MIETVVVAGIGVVLGLAALLVTVRIVRGPSVLDRTVAAEVLTAVVVCALGTEAAVSRHATTLPIVISLSLLGFLASVAVARFMPVARQSEPEQTREDRSEPEQTREDGDPR